MIALLHIPKTAGTTLGAVLQHVYGERFRRIDMSGVHVRDSTGPLEIARHRADGTSEIVTALVDDELEAVAGHVPFGLATLFPPGTRFVTILRDPVERTLSQFFHLRARKGAWRHERLPAPDSDLAIGDALGEGSYIQDNLQTRMLCGLASIDDPLPADALEQAKRNLAEHVELVGTTERFDELLALLNVELGWPSVPYRSARVSETRPRGAEVDRGTVRAVEAATELDRELHAYAGELLTRAIETRRDAVADEREVLRRAQAGERARLRDLCLDGRVELAAKEAELLAVREQLRAQERRYAKRTEAWRELKRALRRRI